NRWIPQCLTRVADVGGLPADRLWRLMERRTPSLRQEGGPTQAGSLGWGFVNHAVLLAGRGCGSAGGSEVGSALRGWAGLAAAMLCLCCPQRVQPRSLPAGLPNTSATNDGSGCSIGKACPLCRASSCS